VEQPVGATATAPAFWTQRSFVQDLLFLLPVVAVVLKTVSQGGLVSSVEFLSEFQ
jgi:hypothetical protein